jgi:hypothetical protein
MSRFIVTVANRKARLMLAMSVLLTASGVRVANAASNPVTWYNSYQYDVAGYRPHVAFNGQTAVEVHQGGSSGTVPLWYRVGTLNPKTQSTVAWGNSAQYDQGSSPSIAICGHTVVEVHQGGAGGVVPLWYRVGTVQGNAISWGSSHQYDRGLSPSLGLAFQIINGNYVLTVVEVHQANTRANSPLRYRVGFVSGSTVSFGKSYQYDIGTSPSVSFDGTNVLEVHDGTQNFSSFALWYRGGAIAGSTVLFGSSHQYDSGAYPSNAQMFGQAIEVHETSIVGISQLRFNAGQGPQGSGYTVYWYLNGQYDQGVNPSVSFYGSAYSGGNIVEVHQGATGLGPLWYRVGLFQATH